MRAKSGLVVLAAVVATAVGGCAAPVLTIRHTLPAAVPLPPDVRQVRAAAFTVRPQDDGGFGPYLAKTLNERLATVRLPAPAAGQGAAGRIVEVGGTVEVASEDARGHRRVRTWNPETRAWEAREVPSLTRTVTVAVEFAVSHPGRAEPLFAADVRRSYDSVSDPRMRGNLGLDRPDDPARVPPVDQVVKELLDGCAAGLAEMIAPQVLVAEVPLRGTLSGEGSAGLKAAGRGDYAAAVRHLEAAVAAEPDDMDLRFNLAAVCEAAGDLEKAAAHYRAVAEGTGGRDPLAADAARRAERVAKRLPPQ